jgi:hypothetical protein
VYAIAADKAGMAFLPRSLDRVVLLVALAVLPFVPVMASGRGPAPPGQQNANGQLPPSLVAAPSVSGSAVEGSSLSADAGSWSGPGLKLALQWQRCDSLGNGCADVAGATDPSFGLATVDVGSTLRVLVTASNKNGSASASSDPSAVVAPAPAAPPPVTEWPPSPTAPPSVSGSAVEGQTLQAAAGSWSGTQPLSFKFQWQQCDSSGGGCAAVAKATGQSYALTANDVGAEMRVEVTASNSAGSATAVSAATSVVSSSLSTLSPSPSTLSPRLSWAPPVLSSPITVPVQDSGQACPSLASPWQNPNQPGSCVLDPARDYILKLGHRVDAGGLVVNGGHNVVIIGGRVTPKLTTTAAEGRGLTFWNQTGTVHVEGVQIDGAGDGILIYAPKAVFQIENVRIGVSAPNHDFSLNHPDVIQTWSGPAEVRIDRLTASSDYQGFFWWRDSSVSTTVLPGRVIQKHVNLFPDPSQGSYPGLGNVTYHMDPSIFFSCQDCWALTGWYSQTYRRKLQDSIAPYFNAATNTYTQIPWRVVGYDGQVVTSSASNDIGRRQGDYIEWPTVNNLTAERWYWGTPTSGDFVPAGTAGTNYASPGYGG